MINNDYLENLTIIVPCYNEEDSLRINLEKLINFVTKNDYKLIFVNDGSIDSSKSILQDAAKGHNISLISHTINRGYGAALKSGINNSITKYCVTIDGDGQHNLEDINKMFELFKVGEIDLLIGNRKGHGSNKFRNLGKSIILNFTKLFLKIKISDLNSGMKMMNTKEAKKLIPLAPDGMSFSDIIVILFYQNKLNIQEIDIKINNRTEGKSTISIKTAFETFTAIFILMVNIFPLKSFSYVATFFLIIGLYWSIPFMIDGKGLTTGSLFIILFAILLLINGLILENFKQIKNILINKQSD